MAVAVFNSDSFLRSLLANLSSVPVAAVRAALSVPKYAEERVVAHKDGCGYWQMYLDVLPKTRSSLFVTYYDSLTSR